MEMTQMSDQRNTAAPTVGIVMGSDSDLGVMRAAAEVLSEFGVSREVRVLSAHRSPDDALQFARGAAQRGTKVIIAGAGGAAHLPGVLAAVTTLPVIGVPIAASLQGLDALLAIVQMPSGIPVATVAVGGARNAGLLAVRILAANDERLREAMERFQQTLAQGVRAKDDAVRAEFADGAT
jgi:5-(carboxyamino)imidazole ribonucleotide mutase